MRNNLPVSQCEYVFAADETLISMADLEGRITYCNHAFVHASGFKRQELIGRPHNLLRHPDMSTEAFRDMWTTIQNGLPWTGLVKNRRKCGDHYWALATATPLMHGEKITGFLSVRTSPTRAQVQAAEALFTRMRKEAAAGQVQTMLERGKVTRIGCGRWMQAMVQPDFVVKVAMTQGVVMAAAMLSVGLGASRLITWLVLCAALAASTAMIYVMAMTPPKRLLKNANRLASGELSYANETGGLDILGQLQRVLNLVSEDLRTVAYDVRDRAHQLEAAVQKNAAENDDLACRTEAQANN